MAKDDKGVHTKGGAIVEGEARAVLREAELGLEGVNIPPELKSRLLSLGEADAHDAGGLTDYGGRFRNSRVLCRGNFGG